VALVDTDEVRMATQPGTREAALPSAEANLVASLLQAVVTHAKVWVWLLMAAMLKERASPPLRELSGVGLSPEARRRSMVRCCTLSVKSEGTSLTSSEPQ